MPSPALSQNDTQLPSPAKEIQAPHVALLVETSLASGREIVRGVARYVREHGPWSLFHAPRALEESAPAWLARWHGQGIIARVTDAEMANLMRRTKLPVVDVLGLCPASGIPLVHVDDDAISRAAFDHFKERGFRHFAFLGLAEPNWSQRRREAFFSAVRGIDAHPFVFEFARADLDSTPWEKRQDRLAGWLRRFQNLQAFSFAATSWAPTCSKRAGE